MSSTDHLPTHRPIPCILPTALLLLCGMLAFPALAETPLHYRTRTAVLLNKCDATGAVDAAGPITMAKGLAFSIIGKAEGDFIIRFWAWEDADPIVAARYVAGGANPKDVTKAKNAIDKNILYRVDANNKPIYFRITQDQLNMFCKPILSCLGPLIGAATLPFKLRPQDGEFSKDVSLSAMGGLDIKFSGTSDVSLGVLGGIGFTSATVDSASTNDQVKVDHEASGLTLSTGLLIRWKSLQIGGFVGWDHLSKTDRAIWIYNGEPWIGIGIGVTIFKSETGNVEEGLNED